MKRAWIDVNIGDPEEHRHAMAAWQRAAEFLAAVGPQYGLQGLALTELDSEQAEMLMQVPYRGACRGFKGWDTLELRCAMLCN